MPTSTLPAPEFPPPHVTAHKPMSLRDILTPGSIRKLADAVRGIADALEFIQTGEEIPVRFRRRLAPVVIGQDGFLPSARGIVWDLRTKHPDGYYLRVAPISGKPLFLHEQGRGDRDPGGYIPE